MTYRLFIDDERFPESWDNVFIARNSFDAMQCVKHRGMPIEIMFDHDLGGNDTVRNFIGFLIGYFEDPSHRFPKGFKFSVHSQNPIGAEWIRGTMQNLVQHFSE